MIETILIMTLTIGLFWMPGMNADIDRSAAEEKRQSGKKSTRREEIHIGQKVTEPSPEYRQESQCLVSVIAGVVGQMNACYRENEETTHQCPLYEALRKIYEREKP